MASNDKAKKKKIIQMQRSLQKEELEHKLDDLSGSDNEDIDFSKEIRPIGYYINDREKMIDEMFSVIKNEKLKKMLPPILKKHSLEEVKADCLVHLLGMSKKRIYAILQGRDLNSSSDSETDSSNSVLGSDSSEEPQITSSTHIKSDVEEIDDTLDISVSKNDLDSLMQDKRSQPTTSRKRDDKSKLPDKPTKKIKTEKSPTLIEISDDEVVQKKKKKDEKRPKKKPDKKPKPKHKHSKEKSKKAKNQSSDESSDKDETKDGSVLVDSKKGKSLLEILELEMRARAIRALLEANTNAAESTSTLKHDPETDQNKSAEKTNNATDDQAAEFDESDSFDVEVINDNEDAIIILDDVDEQIILEPDTLPEPIKEESSKKNAPEPIKEESSKKEDPNEESSKNVSENPSSSDPPKTDIVTIDSLEKKPPQNDSTSNPDNSSEDNLTWPERWAESKGVKEIMQNSKLCANIRKRMRFARMLKQREQEQEQQQQQPQDNQPENPLISELRRVEEGSVDQLQLLKLLDETKQKSDELTKKLNESEQETTNDPENTENLPENTENSPSSEKEEGEVEDEESSNEQVTESNEQNESSKLVSDIEVVEENISCHIDLTDS